MVENGRGVTQGYMRAVELFRLAASQGWADAQWKLVLMYRTGKGVE